MKRATITALLCRTPAAMVTQPAGKRWMWTKVCVRAGLTPAGLLEVTESQRTPTGPSRTVECNLGCYFALPLSSLSRHSNISARSFGPLRRKWAMAAAITFSRT